jgi:hypothetical protein
MCADACPSARPRSRDANTCSMAGGGCAATMHNGRARMSDIARGIATLQPQIPLRLLQATAEKKQKTQASEL